MILRILGLGALLLSLFSASVLAQETSRDAFIEGWFQETAQGDLEAALRQYRKAIELGGPEDRPVMAKAALRMARIAKAQGDQEAWRAQLEQLAQLYPGTEAAEEAQSELTRPEEPRGEQTSSVEEARRDLVEMLYQHDTITTQKVRRVFRALTVEQVLAIWEEVGSPLDSLMWLPKHLQLDEFQDSLVSLLRLSPEDSVKGAALQFLAALTESRLPPALVEQLGGISGAQRIPALSVLLKRVHPEGLLALAHLLTVDETYFDPNELKNYALPELLSDPRPEGRVAMNAVLDAGLKVSRHGGFPGNHDLKQILQPTPGATVFRERVLEFPPDIRVRVAFGLVNATSEAGLRRDLLDQLLADPEPRVRHQAIRSLISSGDEAESREGIERLLDQDRPIDPDLLRAYVWNVNPPVPSEEVLSWPAGDLREYAYALLLQDTRRNPAEVVRLGLERGDPELLRALFQPGYWSGYWRSPRLDTRKSVLHLYQSVFTRTGFRKRLLEGLESASDPTIGALLTDAVAGQENEALRLDFLNLLLRHAQGDRAFRGAGDRLASDPSPRIRHTLLDIYPLEMLGQEQGIRLLLDSDPVIAAKALSVCRDGGVIASAALQASDAQLIHFARKALQLNSSEAVRACYERLPADSPITLECLRFLAQSEIGVVVAALDRSEQSPSALTQEAIRILGQLPLPEPLSAALRRAAEDGEDPGESRRAGRELLQDHHAEVEEAFRVYRISWLDKMIGQAIDSASRGSISLATWIEWANHLARFEAEDELAGMVRSGVRDPMQAGGHGLAVMGRGDLLLELMGQTPFPEWLISAALQADQVPGLVGLAKKGRISAESIVQAAAEAQRADVVAALIAPEGEWPRQFLPVEPSQLKLAIDELVAERAADRLARIVRVYEEPSAVRALVQLNAFEQILDGLPSWTPEIAQVATRELYRLTGIPATADNVNPTFPAFLSEQNELIERWRDALLP